MNVSFLFHLQHVQVVSNGKTGSTFAWNQMSPLANLRNDFHWLSITRIAVHLLFDFQLHFRNPSDWYSNCWFCFVMSYAKLFSLKLTWTLLSQLQPPPRSLLAWKSRHKKWVKSQAWVPSFISTTKKPSQSAHQSILCEAFFVEALLPGDGFRRTL